MEKTKFDPVAKFFHWLLAIMIIIELVFGLQLEEVSGDERIVKLMVHSGFGLSILVLVLARIIWRRRNPPPPLPDTMSPRMQKWAIRNTRLLYFLMLYQPTVGLLHAATYVDGDVKPFGLFNATALLPSAEAVTRVFHVMHALGAFLLILVVLIHLVAAFKHLIIDKDRVFQRMFPFTKV